MKQHSSLLNLLMQPLSTVNKYSSIIIGLTIGILMGGGLAMRDGLVAYGEEEGSIWNEIVAKGDGFSWRDVFGDLKSAGDLYLLVYDKLQNEATQDALKQVARNNGFTTDEMEAIVGGSIVPIFNSPDASTINMTQEEALLIAEGIRTDFQLAKELLEITNEVEVAVTPSEIFANGDLSDSGFDLVRDLEIIEEILFAETVQQTVGGVYDTGRVDAGDPANNIVPEDDFAISRTPAAVVRLGLDADIVQENGDEVLIGVGDEEVAVKVLQADVCEPRDGLTRAVEDEENDNAEVAVGNQNDNDNGFDVEDEENAADAQNAGGNVLDELLAAPADEWVQAWCPGFANTSSAIDNFSEENIDSFLDGFTSLGDNNPAGLFSSFGANYQGDYFQANAAICLTVQQVNEVYRSYNPGNSCIACEISKINENLDKTLAHSLIPNKATGNILESAKCKDVGNLFSLQFTTVWNPIPTPANDDLVFGNNIFEEWNDFASRYKPILLEDVNFEINEAANTSGSGITDSLVQFAPEGLNQQALYNAVQKTVAEYQAEAATNLRNYQDANEAGGQLLYENALLNEMKQMNALFNSFNDLFIDINEVTIPEIQGKPDLG